MASKVINLNLFGNAAQVVNATSLYQKRGLIKRLTPDQKFQAIKSAGLTGVTKRVNPEFERTSRNYVEDIPEVLFTAEYVIDGAVMGMLVVWEKYYDSTHYEVFKHNVFDFDGGYDRILFLDRASLEEERGHFTSYIRDTLGFDELEESEYFVMLDTVVKQDRIYEYKVRAARVPITAEEVDYDFILESKNLLTPVTVSADDSQTLIQFAASSLQNVDLGWVPALVNEDLVFFGINPHEKPMATYPDLDGKKEFDVNTPTNLNDIICILNDSITLFGMRSTFDHMLNVLGGLPSLFREVFSIAIDGAGDRFSYDSFASNLKNRVPVLRRIFDLSESSNKDFAINKLKALSNLSVLTPKDTGTETLTSLSGITKVFKFVNHYYILVSYAERNLDAIAQIKRDVEVKSVEDTFNVAIGRIRDDLTDQIRNSNFRIDSLYNIQTGVEVELGDGGLGGTGTTAPTDDIFNRGDLFGRDDVILGGTTDILTGNTTDVQILGGGTTDVQVLGGAGRGGVVGRNAGSSVVLTSRAGSSNVLSRATGVTSAVNLSSVGTTTGAASQVSGGSLARGFGIR